LTADHVILGVISLYPCSGYDIKGELELGGAGLFSGLSFGSIYPRLKELERQGLIETYQANSGERKRKVHELTGAGWQALSEWLALPSEYPIPTRDELLLKMGFWGSARPEDRSTLIDHLELRREQSLELLGHLTQLPINGVSYISEYGMLLLEYMRARIEAELAWIDKAIVQLEEPPRPPVQDPRGLIAAQRERRAAAMAELERAEESSEADNSC
jgi:PadR family transcriptional regulator AphA